MQTRATRNFNDGFVLTEPELRRIVEIGREQLRKLAPDVVPSENYELQFRNGSVANAASLSDVLALENHGSAQIVRLEIRLNPAGTQPSISCQFENIDTADEREHKPLGYAVSGDDRDWVFVTSSLLEERLQKLKRPNLRWFSSNDLRSGVLFASLLAAMFALFSSSNSSFLIDSSLVSVYDAPFLQPTQAKPKYSTRLKEAKAGGRIRDTTDALIVLEQLREQDVADYDKSETEWHNKAKEWVAQQRSQRSARRLPAWLVPAVIAICPIMVILATGLFLRRYYPMFNFCWGDQLEVFRKKETTRKFVLTGVFVAMVVSFVASILANRLSR